MSLNKEELLVAGALRRLLKNRFILRSRNEHWFQVIVEQQERLRQFLKPIAADLELDTTWGVSYIKSLSEEIEDQLEYQLGSHRILGRYPSLLLYFLRLKRREFYKNPDGEVPIVQREDMRIFLDDFNPHLEASKFEKEFKNAIKELCDLDILLRTGSEDRFEASAVCDVLLPLDQIGSYRAQFETYRQNLVKTAAIEESPEEES